MSSECNEDIFGIWDRHEVCFSLDGSAIRIGDIWELVTISNNSKDCIQIVHHRCSQTDKYKYRDHRHDSIVNEWSHLGSKEFDSAGRKHGLETDVEIQQIYYVSYIFIL